MTHKEKSRRKLHGTKMNVTVEVPFRRKKCWIKDKRKKTHMFKNNLELTLAEVKIMKKNMLIKSHRKP